MTETEVEGRALLRNLDHHQRLQGCTCSTSCANQSVENTFSLTKNNTLTWGINPIYLVIHESEKKRIRTEHYSCYKSDGWTSGAWTMETASLGFYFDLQNISKRFSSLFHEVLVLLRSTCFSCTWRPEPFFEIRFHASLRSCHSSSRQGSLHVIRWHLNKIYFMFRYWGHLLLLGWWFETRLLASIAHH